VTTESRRARFVSLEVEPILAKLSSMEMFDVGPTFGASIAKVSRTEVLRVGSTPRARSLMKCHISIHHYNNNRIKPCIKCKSRCIGLMFNVCHEKFIRGPTGHI